MRFFFFISCCLICLYSCTKNKDKVKDVVSTCPDSTGTISYSQHIVPIINASCGKNAGACHGSSSSFGDFNTYQGFISHPASHIVHSVRQDDPNTYKPMPLAAAKLSDCNIAKIVNWVNQGAKNN